MSKIGNVKDNVLTSVNTTLLTLCRIQRVPVPFELNIPFRYSVYGKVSRGRVVAGFSRYSTRSKVRESLGED